MKQLTKICLVSRKYILRQQNSILNLGTILKKFIVGIVFKIANNLKCCKLLLINVIISYVYQLLFIIYCNSEIHRLKV